MILLHLKRSDKSDNFDEENVLFAVHVYTQKGILS